MQTATNYGPWTSTPTFTKTGEKDTWRGLEISVRCDACHAAASGDPDWIAYWTAQHVHFGM